MISTNIVFHICSVSATSGTSILVHIFILSGPDQIKIIFNFIFCLMVVRFIERFCLIRFASEVHIGHIAGGIILDVRALKL